MPRPTIPDPLDRARRDAILRILIAMREQGRRRGVKPDPTATTASVRAMLMAKARGDRQQRHEPAVWRWEDDLDLSHEDRIRRWLLNVVVENYPFHHPSALSPLGTLTTEQCDRYRELQEDYRAGRIRPPWALYPLDARNQGTER